MNLPASEQHSCCDAASDPPSRSFYLRHLSLIARVAAASSRAGARSAGLILASLLVTPIAIAQGQTQGTGLNPPSLPGQIKLSGPSKPELAAAPGVRKSEVGPTWRELTPAQQASLTPLAASWSDIGEAQKRKWIAISKNYPALPAPEQAKLHSRMTEWTSLSQQQRTQARLNFAETKNLSPGDKTANWQEYQALSPEDRQKLADQAAPKPVGAAAAVKPVAPQKLATVPVPRVDTRHAGTGALGLNGNASVDRNTLLPRPLFTEDPGVRKN